MEYIFDKNTMEFVWTALRESPQTPKMAQAERIFQKIFENGWAFKSDVEDILFCLDNRLNSYYIDVKKFSEQLGIHWEMICFRPKAMSKSISEYEAMRPEDIVLFLIKLERIGFQADATQLVDLFLPHLKNKKIISYSELEILWFKTTRHKSAKIYLTTTEDFGANKKIMTIKTTENYKITAKGLEANKPVLLEISSPKFRKQRSTVHMTCNVCGQSWYKGDSESSFYHRREHKRRMAYLDPKPSQKMLEELKKSTNSELVTSKSPAWKHKEMYMRAVAFKRELNYDFIQWQSPRGNSDLFALGFLLTNTSGVIVGACSFIKSKDLKASYKWKLDWIWICPKERRRGHLSKRWNAFRSQFGDFFVSNPVSDEMKAFLNKRGNLALMNGMD